VSKVNVEGMLCCKKLLFFLNSNETLTTDKMSGQGLALFTSCINGEEQEFDKNILEMVYTFQKQEHLYRKPDKLKEIYRGEIIAWRAEMCEWSYKFVDNCEIDRGIVYVSLSLLDLFLPTITSISQSKLRLAAMASIFLSIKLYSKRRIKSKYLALYNSSQITGDDIEKMEFLILKNLDWFVHPPCPRTFLHYCIILLYKGGEATKEILGNIALYMIELSIADTWFNTYVASEIALGAFFGSAAILEEHNFLSKNSSAEFEAQAIRLGLFRLSGDCEAASNLKARLCGIYNYNISDLNHDMNHNYTTIVEEMFSPKCISTNPSVDLRNCDDRSCCSISPTLFTPKSLYEDTKEK